MNTPPGRGRKRLKNCKLSVKDPDNSITGIFIWFENKTAPHSKYFRAWGLSSILIRSTDKLFRYT